MDLTLARILLFGLSLAGIPLLVLAIRLISGAFAEKVIVEVPHTQKAVSYTHLTLPTILLV